VEAGVKRPVTIGIGVALVVAIGALAIFLLTPNNTSDLPSGVATIKDPASIAQFVQMTHLGILTSTNFLGHRVYTVTANLKNLSDKSIRRIDVKLEFFDYEKHRIHDEVRTAFDLRNPPLTAGMEYSLRIAFENPPTNWNYHVPDT
jgi:hypothetical protein